MPAIINQFLDKTTMYRVVLYSLFAIIAQAFVMSALGVLHYSFLSLGISFITVIGVTTATHFLFKTLYKAPANIESSYISAFIVFLILAPVTNQGEMLWTITASFLIIASKYLFAYNYRHFFNPVAVALFIIGLIGSTSVIWWVGGTYFLPITLIACILVIHKLKRYTLFFSYLGVSLFTIVLLSSYRDIAIGEALTQHILSWPLIFLGVFMLTEPLTTPPTKKLQAVYGGIVGFFTSFTFTFPPLYGTPELAIMIGNLFSFAVSTKSRIFLSFVEKKEIAKDTFEFTFSPNHMISYQSGQYMEWTLPHDSPDTRSIRRYFTIASSPKEDVIRLGVKRAEKGSSFKNALFTLENSKGLLATAVMGDFLLPKDTTKKLVFIAGGIGITPFISMLRTLILEGEKRDVILFYVNKQIEEVAYKDVLEEAYRVCDVKIVYVLSNVPLVPKDYTGEVGFITKDTIEKYVTEIQKSKFYISGPPGMVAAYETLLYSIGVSKHEVITDFFPGFN